MAIDRNPRHFFLDVTSIEANVDADTDQDFVTIEFAGQVTPTVRKRLEEAFNNGEFEIKIKSLA